MYAFFVHFALKSAKIQNSTTAAWTAAIECCISDHTVAGVCEVYALQPQPRLNCDLFSVHTNVHSLVSCFKRNDWMATSPITTSLIV